MAIQTNKSYSKHTRIFSVIDKGAMTLPKVLKLFFLVAGFKTFKNI